MKDHMDANETSQTENNAVQESTKLSSVGQNAFQKGEWEGKKWTKEDGSRDHVIFNRTVADSIDNPDDNVAVNTEVPVTIPDKEQISKTGKVDTMIEHHGKNTLIDYKTNDMSGWSVADAERFGNEHGLQMETYINSPDTPDNSKGYIIAVGRSSKNPEVTQTYSDAVKKHNVNVLYPNGGEIDDVIVSAKKAMENTESNE